MLQPKWYQRQAFRLSMLAVMFLPILMGGDSDCESDGDTVEIVYIIVDAILAIVYAFA